MKSYILKASALIALTCTAIPFVKGEAATYLVFKPGQDRTSDVWQGNAPVVGQNVASDSIVKSWEVVDGDTYPGNYKLVEGSVIHDVPVISSPNVGPVSDVLGFQTAIFNDDSLPLASRTAIADKFPLINQFMTVAPVQMTMYWAGLKMGAGTDYPWLTPEMIQKVESYAEQFHIPLVPPAQ